jgi:DNA-binding CsgD family transcriptional regulator
MSLESTITDALRSSASGLTRTELLAKTRHFDSEENIMRMVSKMLAGGKVEYRGAKYTATRQASAHATAAPAAAAPSTAAGGTSTFLPPDPSRTKTRDRILALINTGGHTTKHIMAALELGEQNVANHLRNLIADGIIKRIPNPSSRKAPLYVMASFAADVDEQQAPSPAPRPVVDRLKAAIANAQAALSQLTEALQQAAADQPNTDNA